MGSWVPGQNFRATPKLSPPCDSPRTRAAEPCLYEQEQDDLCPHHRDPSSPAMSESELPGSRPALSPRGSEHLGGPSQTDITAQASWRKVLREGSSYLETGLRQDGCCECEGNLGCRMGML